MNTITELISLLITLIRVGLGFRVVYCCIRLMSVEDEQGAYKRRLRNALFFLVINELVLILKDLIIAYF